MQESEDKIQLPQTHSLKLGAVQEQTGADKTGQSHADLTDGRLYRSVQVRCRQSFSVTDVGRSSDRLQDLHTEEKPNRPI